eukprot:2988497-Prymnesium_polylepis.1
MLPHNPPDALRTRRRTPLPTPCRWDDAVTVTLLPGRARAGECERAEHPGFDAVSGHVSGHAS